ncbi:hypothetical protein [Polaribacter sp. L3A8]|uniref:hypothetical protein n=1 Tax=Polaribacter sp. L3A8 TaxID=2686361 RepID=UPI00131C28B3|nr:hypothetical protein [Polaribacter sp. L3A8]
MKELNVNQLENLEGGKFIGKSCGGGGSIGGGKCVRTCKYQVFWIKVSEGPEIYDC